jgi:hypothetical protein
MSLNAIACGFFVDGLETARYRVAADFRISKRFLSIREQLRTLRASLEESRTSKIAGESLANLSEPRNRSIGRAKNLDFSTMQPWPKQLQH